MRAPPHDALLKPSPQNVAVGIIRQGEDGRSRLVQVLRACKGRHGGKDWHKAAPMTRAAAAAAAVAGSMQRGHRLRAWHELARVWSQLHMMPDDKPSCGRRGMGGNNCQRKGGAKRSVTLRGMHGTGVQRCAALAHQLHTCIDAPIGYEQCVVKCLPASPIEQPAAVGDVRVTEQLHVVGSGQRVSRSSRAPQLATRPRAVPCRCQRPRRFDPPTA